MKEKLELPIRIYNDLWHKKSDGAIIPDIVFDAFVEEVEAWLQQEHAKDYTGLDDDMPDDYESWLESVLEENELLSTIIG